MAIQGLRELNEEYFRFVLVDAEVSLSGSIPVGSAFLYYYFDCSPAIVGMAGFCGLVSMFVSWLARGREPSFVLGDLILSGELSLEENVKKCSEEYRELARIRKSRRYIVWNTVAAALLFPFAVWIIPSLSGNP